MCSFTIGYKNGIDKNQLAFNGLVNTVGNAFDQSDFLFGAQKSGEEKHCRLLLSRHSEVMGTT